MTPEWAILHDEFFTLGLYVRSDAIVFLLLLYF